MSLPHTLTASQAVQALAAGTLTSEMLVRSCLDQIAAREPEVGAWTYLDPDQALAQAKACDQAQPRGVLHGIPIGVKDIIDTVDMPTAYGSPIYAGHQPVWDAPCVALLRAAGAVILGKTVTTEFAMYTPGKTANPHNPSHTPGGSSSGSAAAVAAEMIPLALGSQTAGSIIRPASYCGIVGYKPTHGLLPTAGMKALSQTLDTLGGFARSVEDLALLRAAFLGSNPTLTPLVQPPRVALIRTPQWPEATPATRVALEAAAHRLATAGAEVEESTLPAPFAALLEAQMTIQCFEGARCCAYELTQHAEGVSPRMREVLEPGFALPFAEYQAALDLAETCRQELSTLFAAYDVLLVPSAPGEAPAGLEATGDPLFNRLWTLLHTPAVTLPELTGPQGLPVGVQVIGPMRADERLLRTAMWMQAHLT
jgi:Asp-tRNA(Asn)/Glu-tRNA(Gln) amidotransferase A subunit family amidase